MTVPTNTIQNVTRVGVREDLSNKIAELFPDDTPFLNAIGTGKCTATKTEWQTDGLAAANPNNAKIQGDDLANDTRSDTTRVSTYTQISTKVVGVSSTLEATNKAGRKSELAREIMKAGRELRTDMEMRACGNYAIRTAMAQLATWLAGASGPLAKSGGAVTGAITGLANGSSVIDGAGNARGIGYRNIPLTAKSASYTLALSDVGQGVSTNAGVTVPANATTAFAIGDGIALYNNSAATITVTQASGVTLRLAGSATSGNRSLAQRGLATLIKVGTDEWVVSGTGLS